jgi:NADH-quinone oxidoreductase subunit G
MLADINVSEPKPPVDTDSPMSYTMEGLRSLPPSSLVPFFWSPGWNSVQATAKYQEEVGGPLRGGDPGIRLIEASPNGQTRYFEFESDGIESSELYAVPLYHIFGSDELSARSPALSERIPGVYVMINSGDAKDKNIENGQKVVLNCNGIKLDLPVLVSEKIAKGLIGIPVGLPGTEFIQLPMKVTIES